VPTRTDSEKPSPPFGYLLYTLVTTTCICQEYALALAMIAQSYCYILPSKGQVATPRMRAKYSSIYTVYTWYRTACPVMCIPRTVVSSLAWILVTLVVQSYWQNTTKIVLSCELGILLSSHTSRHPGLECVLAAGLSVPWHPQCIIRNKYAVRSFHTAW
jgi:hypothetical protein